MHKKYIYLVALLAVFAVAFGSTQRGADAWAVDGSGTYSMTSTGQTATVFTSGASTLVGVMISANSGTVDVESVEGAIVTQLGTVAAGEAEVFEGSYFTVRVKSTTSTAEGSWSRRILTGPGRVIATGTFSLDTTAARVYTCDSTKERAIEVTADGGTVTIRTSSAGTNLIVIEDGDSGVVCNSGNQFWMLGSTSSVTASTTLADPKTSTWSDWLPFTGNGDGDVDEAHEVGTIDTCYEYQIKNTGSVGKKLTIKKWKHGNTPDPSEVEVDPGETHSFSCDWDTIDIVHDKDGGKADFRYRKN